MSKCRVHERKWVFPYISGQDQNKKSGGTYIMQEGNWTLTTYLLININLPLPTFLPAYPLTYPPLTSSLLGQTKG